MRSTSRGSRGVERVDGCEAVADVQGSKGDEVWWVEEGEVGTVGIVDKESGTQ